MLFNPGVPHRDSFAKYAAAFFTISRSSLTLASSRRNREFSASSSVLGRFTAIAPASAPGSFPALLSLIQFHKLESGMPSRFAASPFPADSANLTASSLNSSVYCRLGSDVPLLISFSVHQQVNSVLMYVKSRQGQVGSGGTVAIQVACSELDAQRVFESIADYAPDATALTADDLLAEPWDSAAASLVVDWGLSEEFFLPLQTYGSFRLDPYIPLVSALARARDGEAICFQVLIEPVKNPWRKAILHAVAPDGSPLLAMLQNSFQGRKRKPKAHCSPAWCERLPARRTPAGARSISSAEQVRSRRSFRARVVTHSFLFD